jgi:hypothetical protein
MQRMTSQQLRTKVHWFLRYTVSQEKLLARGHNGQEDTPVLHFLYAPAMNLVSSRKANISGLFSGRPFFGGNALRGWLDTGAEAASSSARFWYSFFRRMQSG